MTVIDITNPANLEPNDWEPRSILLPFILNPEPASIPPGHDPEFISEVGFSLERRDELDPKANVDFIDPVAVIQTNEWIAPAKPVRGVVFHRQH
jgi:hypothetical protein